MKRIKCARILLSICVLTTTWQRPASLLQHFGNDYPCPTPHTKKNPSLWKTTGIWCLLWCFSNGRAMPRAGDQNPNVKGEKEEQKRTSSCSAASWAQWARSAHSLQTAEGGKPKARRRIRPTDPAHLPAKSVYFHQTWDFWKNSPTAGLRTHTADVCCHQNPCAVCLKRTPHILNCFL